MCSGHTASQTGVVKPFPILHNHYEALLLTAPRQQINHPKCLLLPLQLPQLLALVLAALPQPPALVALPLAAPQARDALLEPAWLVSMSPMA